MPENSFLTMFKHLKRMYFDRFPMAKPVDLQGKKIIVTGAGVGSIGYETAKTLAEWGAHVIITTRSRPEKIVAQLVNECSQSGKPVTIDAFPLDLTRADSVEQFVRWYQRTHGDRLDVLVNNAGIHADLSNKWTSPQLSQDGFEVHWRTNYLGPMQLTFKLLPLLKKTGMATGDARVVFVASHLHVKAINAELFGLVRAYNSWIAYGISKLGIIHSAFELQRRFAKEFNLQGVVLHPGSIATNISHKGLDNNKLLQRLRSIFSLLESWVLLTPVQGAQTTIHCASSPDLKGGIYYDRLEPGAVSPEADDTAVAARLWEQTEKWVAAQSEVNSVEPA